MCSSLFNFGSSSLLRLKILQMPPRAGPARRRRRYPPVPPPAPPAPAAAPRASGARARPMPPLGLPRAPTPPLGLPRAPTPPVGSSLRHGRTPFYARARASLGLRPVCTHGSPCAGPRPRPRHRLRLDTRALSRTRTRVWPTTVRPAPSQVNRIIAALGRQTSIPSISSSVCITSCSTQSATSSTNVSAVPLPPQLTAHTPPSPQRLAITDKTDHMLSKDDHTPLVPTRKRLLELIDASQQSTHQTEILDRTVESSSPKHSGKLSKTFWKKN